MVAASFLGFEFVDAAEVIFFDENGNFESEHTNRELSERLEHVEKAVIPGFYGSKPDGTIKTFSRAVPMSPAPSWPRPSTQICTRTGRMCPAFW